MSQIIRNPYVSVSAALTRKSTARPEKIEASRALSGMLLAAVLAALLVVAEQLIDTWADGHMLAAWVALWTVAFAGLALLVPPLRKVSGVVALAITAWSYARQERRMEETLWEYAQRDPRIMSELQQALMRSQG
jgi:hypothetical protein